MSMLNRQVFNTISGWLVPGACVLCSGVAVARGALCGGCRRLLFNALPQRCLCPVCGGVEVPGLCSCRRDGPPVRSLLQYRPVGSRLVQALKFGKRPEVAELLAALLVSGFERPEADCICWVPLHLSRRRKRGYDQAELIARFLGKRYGLPGRGVLKRVRKTAPQARSGVVERGSNVAAAFAAAPGCGRVLLIDDVVTTGATVLACVAALEEQGWVVADVRTPFYG